MAPAEPALHLHNPAAVPQSGVLRASFPLPRHWAARSLRGLRVGESPAYSVPLLRWPDGSLAVVQLQWHADLAAGAAERVMVHCEPDPGDAKDSMEPPAIAEDKWPKQLPLRTEVVDPWGRTYVARLPALSDRSRGLALQQHAVMPNIDPSTGAALFATEVFVTRGLGEAFGELTLILGNGRDAEAQHLGPARLLRFSLLSDDPRLRLRPRFAAANLLPMPVAEHDASGAPSGFRHDLLGPSEMLYLGDGTAKVFSFDVCFDDGLTADERLAVEARAASPSSAFADLDWVRSTGAFGLFGGPAPVASRLDDLAAVVIGQWHREAEFGPFGGFGNAKEAAAIASAHNAPTTLHNVLRWRSATMLSIAQVRVHQALLRPLPGHQARLPAATEALRQGLSARAMQRPHGFEALDYEHASVDLLLDLWWLTGDELVRDELRRHGAAIVALLQRIPFMTSRGEGHCAQALAAVAWATGDDQLLAWAVRRVHEQVLPRLSESPLVALAQPPHPEVLGGDAWFDAPWQMAALVHGLCALHRRTGDPAIAAAAVDVARKMAVHGWVEGQGPKYFMHARDPQRFCMPRGIPPLQGTASFAASAFVLAAELAGDDHELRQLLAARADTIVAGSRGVGGLLSPQTRADPWFQSWLDRN